jgi:hypothetical protein
MKTFNFFSIAIALVLMVTAVSCTTMRGTDDGYYETQRVQGSPNRIVVDDPYRGTVVLERDPYSGRYYEVNSYGGYGSVYGNRYDRRYNTYGNGYSRNNRYYRNNNTSVYQQAPQATPEQKRQYDQNKGEARRKVLGN